MNLINKLKKSSVSFTLSILLPVIVMMLVYYEKGIFIGGNRTILASDAYAQFSVFLTSFRNVLHGEQSIFYTWSGSLGLNYLALASYYVLSIFSPITYFFENSSIADTYYILTLLKFGAAGGAFWVFGSQTFKLSKWLVTGLSVSYALMSFFVAYSPIIVWLDAMIYLPLVILGIHRLAKQNKPTLLFISYLLLFISNFYMGFMIAIFSFLYFITLLITQVSVYKKALVPYLITAILAGGASMIIILPSLLDLTNNGESLTVINQFFTQDMGPWDLLTKNLIGSYDTAKFGAAPFIYVGVLPLLFVGFYFFNKEIILKERIIYGVFLVLMIASFYIQGLNIFWQGLHSPNMFLFRYSYLFSFLCLYLAMKGMEKFNQASFDRLVNCLIIVFALFIAAYFFANRKRYSYIFSENLLMTIAFLVIYVALWFFLTKKPKWGTWIYLIMLVFLTLEAGINSRMMTNGILKDWNYPGNTSYVKRYQEIDSLVKQTKKENGDTLYRMTNLDSITSNDSFTFGYSGIEMFSSIRNRHSSMYLSNLGFRSEGTNLRIDYENNTIIMDELLGIKYTIAKENPMKFGFDKVATEGDYSLYKNNYALPTGILTDEAIFEEEAVSNQTELFNHLAEDNSSFVSFTELKEISKENIIKTEDEKTVTYTEEIPGKKKRITWEVSVPAHTQAYLSLHELNSGAGSSEATAKVTVNGIAHQTEMRKSGQYYTIGWYDKDTTVKVAVEFDQIVSVSLVKPDVLLLNTKNFTNKLEKIQKKGVAIKINGRKASAKVDLKKDQVLLTTIPYDKGWSVKIDGKKVEIPTFKDAFLAVPVSAGKHKIEFSFIPQGFIIGLSLFISCISLFIGYLSYQRYKKNNIERIEK